MKKEKSSGKQDIKKYYVVAAVGLIAVIAASVAVMRYVRDDGTGEGAKQEGTEYSEMQSDEMREGTIEFSELYPRDSVQDRYQSNMELADNNEDYYLENPEEHIAGQEPEDDENDDAGMSAHNTENLLTEGELAEGELAGAENETGEVVAGEDAIASENAGAGVNEAGAAQTAADTGSETTDKSGHDSKEGDDSVSVSGNSASNTEDSLEAAIAALEFNEANGMLWPVTGSIIMKYSADHGIYHSTLKQFRTNPALIIGCEEGTPVAAAATGIVTEIYESPQTGITVKTSIGDDFTVVYGQLAESELKVGDKLEAGIEFGSIAAASRFYSIEGPNLYFQVIRGEEAVNPELFLKTE